MQYLIVKSIISATAIIAFIWLSMKKRKSVESPDDVTTNYAEPIELENGEFAIPKPDDETLLDGIQEPYEIRKINFSEIDYNEIE